MNRPDFSTVLPSSLVSFFTFLKFGFYFDLGVYVYVTRAGLTEAVDPL